MGISEADVCDGSDKGGASAWGDDGKLLVGFRWGNLSARVCGGEDGIGDGNGGGTVSICGEFDGDGEDEDSVDSWGGGVNGEAVALSGGGALGGALGGGGACGGAMKTGGTGLGLALAGGMPGIVTGQPGGMPENDGGTGSTSGTIGTFDAGTLTGERSGTSAAL